MTLIKYVNARSGYVEIITKNKIKKMISVQLHCICQFDLDNDESIIHQSSRYVDANRAVILGKLLNSIHVNICRQCIIQYIFSPFLVTE